MNKSSEEDKRKMKSCKGLQGVSNVTKNALILQLDVVYSCAIYYYVFHNLHTFCYINYFKILKLEVGF